MNPREFQRKSLRLSLALHGSALVLMLVLPWIFRACARNRPNEKLMFVEFTVSVPPPPAPADPAPVPEPPEPEPRDAIPVPDKKADPPKPPKKDIRQTNVVTRKDFKAPPPKDKPTLTAAEIEAALKKGARLSDRTRIPAGEDQLARAAYHNHVRERMYTAWQQPPQLKSLPGLSAEVRITVAPDGRITARVKTRGSGNELMDDSVLKAVNSVKALRALPAIYKSPIDIDVAFEIGQ